MFGDFLKVHAASIAIHAGLALVIGLMVPAARRVLTESVAVEFEILELSPEPARPVTPPLPVEAPMPAPTPSAERPRRVPEKTKVALVEKPRPFQEQADPFAGTREAPPDTPALPVATTPLPSIDMESTVGAGSATEYVTTSESGGTLGVRAGSGGGRGGMGAGRGAPGSEVAGQGGADLKVSRDWQITSRPEPLNDRDFEPEYPPVAKRERRDGLVVVRLWIDADGRVDQAALVERAGHGFDEAAVAYARKLRFRPAKAGSRDVASKIEWTVEFNARD